MTKLLTEQGVRSLYDAVSQCTRCGFCEQACPTYVVTGREAWSGRGRNQLVRMMIEGKFKDRRSAEEALSSCLLCSGCTSACPARVPTADIVLEGRRLLRAGRHPWLARLLSHLLTKRPAILAGLLRWGCRFKRWGLAGLLARTRILSLLGLRGIESAINHVDEAPKQFLYEYLESGAGAVSREPNDRPNWLYFAACGTNYLLPRVGKATTSVLKTLKGPGKFLSNPCCGLLSYNYGDLESARILAKANIERTESFRAGESAPVVGDCSSCVSHLKSYPQLFLDDPGWRERAERFSARVKDFVEIVDGELVEGETVLRRGKAEPSTHHDACRARNGQGIIAQPRSVMQAVEKDFRELPEADQCCGGAGAFAFVHPGLSEELLKRKIANIASTHARFVTASSTSCLVQLARGLKKYYPECRVLHLSELVEERLRSRG